MTRPELGTVDESGFIWTVPRQTFVKLYVATGDARAAARDSKLPAAEDPEALLENPSVAKAVSDMHEQVLRRVYETEDTVLSRYSNWAEANVVDYLDYGKPDSQGRVMLGSIKPKDFRTLPRHMQQRIKKFEISFNAAGEASFKMELNDPMKANDSLARILGLGDQATGDSKDFAESVSAWLKEIDTLDSHYVEPDDADPAG